MDKMLPSSQCIQTFRHTYHLQAFPRSLHPFQTIDRSLLYSHLLDQAAICTMQMAEEGM
jgi:hypothetical protein